MQKDIIQFIEDIRNENFYSLSEAQIQQSIILPLLSKLGWNTAKVKDEVIPQFKIGKGKVDFALKMENDCKVIIEAKRGKEDLININNEMEIMYYASGISVPLAILTNGKSWQFYLPLLGGGLEKKRFCTVDISEPNLEDTASKFIELLSKDGVKKIDVANYEKLIYDRYRKPVKTIVEDIRQIKPVKPKESYLQDYSSVNNDFTKVPIYSFYFNGTVYQAETWKDLLVGILDTMYSMHRKDFDKVLGVTGKQGRIYFSRRSNEVNNPLEIADTGIYVDTKLSSNNIVRLCCDIIYEFGYSDDDLEIKTSKSNIVTSDNTKIDKIVDRDTVVSSELIKEEELQPITEGKTLKPVTEETRSIHKKEKYIEYKKAIQKTLPNINKSIASAGGKEIKFKINDIVNVLGENFKDKNPASIYWGLKYVLFYEGIVVRTESQMGEIVMLIMRRAGPTDVLPKSLARDDDSDAGDRKERGKNIEKERKKKGLFDEIKGFFSN